MLKALINLIRGFIKEDKDKKFYRGLYIVNETPKTYGTKIRRRNE